MQIEITPNNIFIFDIDEHGKLTGEKFRIEEDVDALQSIMDATTSKMMEIINDKKNR